MSDNPYEYDPYEAAAAADEQRTLSTIGTEQIFGIPNENEVTANSIRALALPQPQLQPQPISYPQAQPVQAPQPQPAAPQQALPVGLPANMSPQTAAFAQHWATQMQQVGARRAPRLMPERDTNIELYSIAPIGKPEEGGFGTQVLGAIQNTWAETFVGFPKILEAAGAPLPDALSKASIDFGNTLKSWADENFKTLSPEAKQAATSSLINSTVFGGKVDPATGEVPKPGSIPEYAKGIAADLLGFLVALPIPVATGSRIVLQGGARALGVGSQVASRAGAIGTVGGLTAAGAAQNVGQGRALLKEEIDKTSDNDLRTKDFYRTLREQGVPESEARERLVDHTLEVGQQALAGGIGMLALSAIAPGLGLRGLTRAITPSSRIGAVGVNALEGAVGGGGQMGLTESATQTGAMAAGARQEYDPNRVLLAAGGGAAMGGALGGAVGYGLGGSGQRTPGRVDSPPIPSPVDPAQAAAVANTTRTPPTASNIPPPAAAVPPVGQAIPTSDVMARMYGQGRPMAGTEAPAFDTMRSMYGQGIPVPPEQRPFDPNAPMPGMPRPGPAPFPTAPPTAPPPFPPGPAGPMRPGPGPFPTAPPAGPPPLGLSRIQRQYGTMGEPAGFTQPAAATPSVIQQRYGGGETAPVARGFDIAVPPAAAAAAEPITPPPRPSDQFTDRQPMVDALLERGLPPEVINQLDKLTSGEYDPSLNQLRQVYDRVVGAQPAAEAAPVTAAAPTPVRGEEVMPPATKAIVEKGKRKRTVTPPAEKAKATESGTDGGTWRAVRPGEIFQPGGRFRVDVVTGAQEVFERAPPAAAVGEQPATQVGRDAVSETPTRTSTAKIDRDEITQRLTALGLSKREIGNIQRKNIVNARAEVARLEAAEDAAIARVTTPKSEPEAAPPKVEQAPARDVTKEVREGVLTDEEDAIRSRALDAFTASIRRVLGEQNISETQRNNTLDRRQQAWEQGFDAGLRNLTTPQSIKNNVIAAFREGRAVGAGIRSNRERPVVQPTRPVVGLVRRETEQARREAEARKPKPSEPDIEEQVREEVGGQELIQDYDEIIGKPAPLTGEGTPRVTSDQWANRQLDEQGHEIYISAEDMDNLKLTPEQKKQNLFKIGRSLEQLIQDGMKPYEAYLDYGLPKGTGRPRNLATFLDYIDAELARLNDRSNQHAAIAKQKSYGEESSAAKTQMNEELRRFGDEHKAFLNFIRNEINQEIAERSGTTIKGTLDSDAVSGSIERLSRLMSHPDAINPTWDLVNRGGVRGVSMHDVLNSIANNPFILRHIPHAAAYARTMIRMLPADIKAYSFEDALLLYGHRGDNLREALTSNRYAGLTVQPRDAWLHYSSASDPYRMFVALNVNAPRRFVENVLHESSHLVTTRHFMKNLSVNDRIMFDLIAKELGDQGYPIADNLGGGTYRNRLDYALSDTDELHTMMMTSPHLFEIASQIRPSQEFINGMRKMGYLDAKPKTLWQAFTGFIRKSLGLPNSYKTLMDYALRPMQDIMDRADVYQQTQYNRNTRSSEALRPIADDYRASDVRDVIDRELSTSIHAIPDFDMMQQRAREVGGDVAYNTWERAKRGMTKAALPMSHKDQIVQYNRPDWNTEIRDPVTGEATGTRNLIEAERDAADNRAARAAKFMDDYFDRAAEIASRTDLKTGEALVEASMAQVDPSTTAGNTRANTLYNNLNSAQKQAFKDVLGIYKEIEVERRKADATGLARDMLPTGTEAQRKILAEALGSKRGIDQMLADGDNSAIAQALGEKWLTNRDTVTKLARLMEKGWLDVYVPFRRPGNYTLTYKKTQLDRQGNVIGPGEDGMERFQSPKEAADRRVELSNQKHAVSGENEFELVSGVMDARTTPRSAVPNAAIIEEMGGEIEARIRSEALLPGETADQRSARAEAAGERAREALTKVMINRLHSSVATRQAARQGVHGANPNMREIIPADIVSLGNHIGSIEYGPLQASILKEMDRHMRRMFNEDPNNSSTNQRRQWVVEELKARGTEADDVEVGVNNVLRFGQQATFVHSLLSPSQMIVNSAEMYTHAVPRLAARHKLGPATAALSKAAMDLLPSSVGRGLKQTLEAARRDMRRADWDLSKVIEERLIKTGMAPANAKALVDAYRQAGFLSHSQLRELRRMTNPTGVPGVGLMRKAANHFMNFSTILQHHVEIANRMVIGKAAFDLELKSTGSVKQAAAYAVEMARSTGANPAPHNLPRISTSQGVFGAWGAPMSQFRRYAMFAYSNLAVLIKESFSKTVDATTKREARKALGMLVAAHSMAAGTLTWLADPLRYILGAWDWITGKTPHNYSYDVRRYAAQGLGPAMGEIATRGVFRYVGGVNVSGRMGMENPAGIPQLQGSFYDARTWATALGSLATGAPGRTATDFASAIGALGQGKYQQFFERLVPRIVRDPAKAYREATQGVKDTQGRVILAAKDVTLSDAIKTSIGFQPAERANLYERRGAMTDVETGMAASRQIALRAAADARTVGERNSAARLVKLHNDTYRTDQVDYNDVLKLQKRDRDRLKDSRLAGLTVPRKSQGYVAAAGAF